jgi:AcrR family transcriptional regulator
MSDNETKEKILRTAQAMLQEGLSAEDITVRQIAARAGIGIGTINYHYQSKDKLLSDAVSGLMTVLANELEYDNGISDPFQKLKQFLMTIGEMSLKYYEISRIHVTYELEQGDFSICYYIVPLLKEIFKSTRNETEIKLVAIELITSMQSIFLKKEAFFRYTGINLQDPGQREEALNIFLKRLC